MSIESVTIGPCVLYRGLLPLTDCSRAFVRQPAKPFRQVASVTFSGSGEPGVFGIRQADSNQLCGGRLGTAFCHFLTNRITMRLQGDVEHRITVPVLNATAN